MHKVNPELKLVIQQLLNQSDLNAILRADDKFGWESVWARLSNQMTHYADEMIEYQHAYLSGDEQQIVFDLSLILMHDGKPCGIWPLTLQNTHNRISSCGSAILSPVFIERLPARTIKKQVAASIQFIQLLAAHYKIPMVSLSERLVPSMLGSGLSEWHQQWMTLGASPHVKHDLFVDLSIGFDAIKSNMRKSYRSLISSAQKLWTSTTMNHQNADESTWLAFKSLHKEVAGRSTRSDATWSLQYNMLLDNKAFLINLYSEQDQRLVGAGFFQYTKDYGQYSVAAYDRSLFDQPVGHLVQMRAMEQLHAKGIRWYELGERMFPADQPSPSQKEMAISNFKQGFATHLSARFVLDFELSIDTEIRSLA